MKVAFSGICESCAYGGVVDIGVLVAEASSSFQGAYEAEASLGRGGECTTQGFVDEGALFACE